MILPVVRLESSGRDVRVYALRFARVEARRALTLRELGRDAGGFVHAVFDAIDLRVRLLVDRRHGYERRHLPLVADH